MFGLSQSLEHFVLILRGRHWRGGGFGRLRQPVPSPVFLSSACCFGKSPGLPWPLFPLSNLARRAASLAAFFASFFLGNLCFSCRLSIGFFFSAAAAFSASFWVFNLLTASSSSALPWQPACSAATCTFWRYSLLPSWRARQPLAPVEPRPYRRSLLPQPVRRLSLWRFVP